MIWSPVISWPLARSASPGESSVAGAWRPSRPRPLRHRRYVTRGRTWLILTGVTRWKPQELCWVRHWRVASKVKVSSGMAA